MSKETFHNKIFGPFLNKEITLTQLNPNDERDIKEILANIEEINELEQILSGYIGNVPFIIYKKNKDIFICTNKQILYYDIETFNINIIRHIGDNKTKQYTANYLKITIKKDNTTLNQEESIIEDKLPKGYKYHTRKHYSAKNDTQSMSFTCDIYWKEEPTTQKPPLIMGNIIINDKHKKFAFLLNNGIYIPGDTDIQTFDDLQQLLKETGNMSIEHSEEFIDTTYEIIKPDFIKAIEILIKNNIQIQENTITISGHQFKLEFPHQNNID